MPRRSTPGRLPIGRPPPFRPDRHVQSLLRISHCAYCTWLLAIEKELNYCLPDYIISRNKTRETFVRILQESQTRENGSIKSSPSVSLDRFTDFSLVKNTWFSAMFLLAYLLSFIYSARSLKRFICRNLAVQSARDWSRTVFRLRGARDSIVKT